MPFVRFSRDKRGYEHIYLVHAATRRGKPSRPRILYWYRTPPGVIVGREPFDPAVRRALEAQNPDVTFDWNKLVKMTAPPPDVEPWRERRRAEQAAKRARRAEERDQEEAAPADVETAFPLPLARDSTQAGARYGEAWEGDEPGEGDDSETSSGGVGEEPAERGAVAAAPLASGPEQPGQRRRRRRRGGRGRRPASGSEPTSSRMPPESPKGE